MQYWRGTGQHDIAWFRIAFTSHHTNTKNGRERKFAVLAHFAASHMVTMMKHDIVIPSSFPIIFSSDNTQELVLFYYLLWLKLT